VFDARLGSPPILSAAAPRDFGFLDARAPITVDGAFLEASELVGSDVFLANGASVVAPNVVIAALPGAGLDPARHGVLSIDASSIASGKASLRARSIALFDADIAADLLRLTAEDIAIEETVIRFGGSLELDGSRSVKLVGSGITDYSFDDVVIRGGSVELRNINLSMRRLLIDASDILIDEFALLDVEFDESDASAQLIARSTLTLTGGSRLLARSVGSRRPDRPPLDLSPERIVILLSAPRIVIENDSLVASSTLYNAIDLRGRVPPVRSGLLFPDRRGADIRIEADDVTLRSGGGVDSSSLSHQRGGSIEIVARRSIDITDPTSGVSAVTAFDGAVGRVLLRAPRVTVRNGARVSTEVLTPKA